MSGARSISILLVASQLTLSEAARAQRTPEPTTPNFHKIAVVDSAALGHVEASPDGRWIAIDKENTLWLVPADGHAKPTRLLSPGHVDRFPIWFLTSDRIAFVSNRVARNGSQGLYGMIVDIDPVTGTAKGTPRQVTTEPIQAFGDASPDGKWLSYAILGEKGIKVVPVNGGTARTIVMMDKSHLPIRWSRDGKTLFFPAGHSEGGPPNGAFYKVSVSGGPATRAYRDAAARPFGPFAEQHVVVTRAGPVIRRLDLFDEHDRLVGSADIQPGMTISMSNSDRSAFHVTMKDVRYEAHLVSTDGRNHRLIPSSFSHVWVDGWTADGTGLIVDGEVDSKPAIAVIDTAGKTLEQVILPLDAGATGWEGNVGHGTTFRRGNQGGPPSGWYTGPDALYVGDPKTGTTRLVTTTMPGPTPGRVTGRGLQAADGDRILTNTTAAGGAELRAFGPDGGSTLVRRFSLADSAKAAGVYGDRIAWLSKAGDSAVIFEARGPAGVARRLATLPYPKVWRMEMGWSYDGSMLCVLLGDQRNKSSIAIIRPDAQGPGQHAIRQLSVADTGLWSTRWAPDGRALYVIGMPPGARNEGIVRVPLNAEEGATVLTTPDESVDDYFHVSPDGKYLTYPQTRVLGSSIWRVEFTPPRR